MKGLLHSKKFRNNLRKWLCMYVGVILLLTTVVTYSKYISKFQGNSASNTAKFQIELEPINVDESTHLITDSLTYTFYVDVTNVDVKANLKLLTFVDSSFTIEDISDGFIEDVNNETTQQGKQMRVYNATIPDDFTGRKEFQIKVKYNGSDNKEISTDYNKPTEMKNIITIGYKLEQVSIN